MGELLYQCAGCGARVLRARPIDSAADCPRCGRRGFLRRQPEPATVATPWLKRLVLDIEGRRGPVRWH